MKKVGVAEGNLQSSAQMERALMLGSSAQKTLPANKPRSAVTCPMWLQKGSHPTINIAETKFSCQREAERSFLAGLPAFI